MAIALEGSRGKAQVAGQSLTPVPEDPKELGAFVEECRDTIIRRLAVLQGNGEGEDRALKSA